MVNASLIQNLKEKMKHQTDFVIDLYSLCPKSMKSRFNKMNNKTYHNIEPVPISNIKIVEISKSISLASLLTTNVYSCLAVKKKNNEIKIVKIYSTNTNIKTNK